MLIPFAVATNAPIAAVEPVEDIFRMHQRNALFSAAIAATECAFDKLNLKVGEKLEKEINSDCDQLNKSSNTFNMSHSNAVPSSNEWKCPNCGKIQQNYVGTCGCGQQKPR